MSSLKAGCKMENPLEPYEIEPKKLRNSQLVAMMVLCLEGPKTKAELAKLTGRRWPTMDTVVKQFLQMGLIQKVGEKKSETGNLIESYGLTAKGLLSFIGRIPGPSYYFSTPLEKNPILAKYHTRIDFDDYKQKRNNDDIFLEMSLRSSDEGALIKHYRDLFPLVFEHLEDFRLTVSAPLTRIAFQTLEAYDHPAFAPPLPGGIRSLESVFTLEYYMYLLEESSKFALKLDPKWQKWLEETISETILKLHEDTQLTNAFREASRILVERFAKQTSFLLSLEKRYNNDATDPKQIR